MDDPNILMTEGDRATNAMRSQYETMSRREALRAMSVGASFMIAHDVMACSPMTPPKTVPSVPDASPAVEPLILELRLLTAAPFNAMREFYHDTLGFRILEEGEDRIGFAAGTTKLVFCKAGPEHESPFYHFAFNIPQNKILAARDWQLKRSVLVPTPEHLIDPKFPKDVRHFRNWNAHSVFFFDPAYNIVEYIARHELKNDAGGEFTTADILYASEIGFIVEDQQKAARILGTQFDLKAYPPGTNEWWWAMGDERGLLLCLNKGRVFGENTATPKTFTVFPTEATIRVRKGEAPPLVEFDGLPYRIRTR